MNELQMVLLGVAVLAVAGIYWQARRRSGQQAVWRERPKEFQPSLFDDDGVGKPRKMGEGRQEPQLGGEPVPAMPPGILAVSMHSVTATPLPASELHMALENAGLSYGEFGYYHKLGSDGLNLYSVGAITKPGTLNPDDAETLVTPGLVFYLQLDELGDRAIVVLDDVITTAQSLGDKFDAQLVDDNRQPLTIEGLEALRDSVRTRVLG